VAKKEKICPMKKRFFVERLSNITSIVNWKRITYLVKKTTTQINNAKLKFVYEVQIDLIKQAEKAWAKKH